MFTLRLLSQAFLAFFLALVLVFSGCETQDKTREPATTAQTQESSPATQATEQTTATQPDQAGSAKKGKFLYFANCIACHNTDPTKAGSVGPAISDSSKELLTLKITQGTYPAGYQPKRTTKLMPPLPNLKAGIPFLHAFLNP